jgi:hypothetical protein
MHAPPGDYSGLLIKASDLGPEFNAPNPPMQNPDGPEATGVRQSFINADGSAQVTAKIAVLVNPATAESVESSIKDELSKELSKEVPGAAIQPIDVGMNGQMVTFEVEEQVGTGGTTSDKWEAETNLMFAQGKAVVVLKFRSAPNDPVPPEFALSVARKQADNVKKGLPS